MVLSSSGRLKFQKVRRNQFHVAAPGPVTPIDKVQAPRPESLSLYASEGVRTRNSYDQRPKCLVMPVCPYACHLCILGDAG
jgi:hypothetical protein